MTAFRVRLCSRSISGFWILNISFYLSLPARAIDDLPFIRTCRSFFFFFPVVNMEGFSYFYCGAAKFIVTCKSCYLTCFLWLRTLIFDW